MTAPSTDDLTGSTDAKAMNRCLLRNLDEANATISALRKAAEGMAGALRNYEETIREHIATEFPHSAWIPVNLKEAIDQGDAALAEHRKLKP